MILIVDEAMVKQASSYNPKKSYKLVHLSGKQLSISFDLVITLIGIDQKEIIQRC